MTRPGRLLAGLALFGLGLGWAGAAAAAEKCKAQIDKKTGVIEVSAANVDGATLAWGTAPSAIANPFFDATCVAGTKAKACTLADPASLASQSPPASCRLHVGDANGTCALRIPGCVPHQTILTRSLTLEPAAFDTLNASVVEGAAVSGIVEIPDAAVSADTPVQAFVQNGGGYWLQLPFHADASDGSFERMHLTREGAGIRVYYHRFEPPSTHTYVPQNPLPFSYHVLGATPE